MEVRQTFPRPRIEDVAAAVRDGLRRLAPAVRGRRIAVTAGSRGIRDIVGALSGVAVALREAGAEPVIVAAMGSHGGGTAEGQRRVLAHLGITEEAVGAPVHSAMEVSAIGRTPGGYTIYLDQHAAACDGIVVINRIKPHTAFQSDFGSGLMKMMAVGLGKAPGAAQVHRLGAGAMAPAIREVAAGVLASGRVVAGVALLENAYDETAAVEVLAPPEIPQREPALYAQAQAWMPRLPVDEAEVLVIDEMGKNFSGSGMDVNIIGRWRHAQIPDPPTPRYHRIGVLRLAAASEGNAQGVGLADVITARLAAAIDLGATYMNAITSSLPERVALPLIASTDRAAVQIALRTAGLEEPSRARLLRIRNTLHIDTVWVSETLLPAISGRAGVTIGGARPWAFSDGGDLEDLP